MQTIIKDQTKASTKDLCSKSATGNLLEFTKTDRTSKYINNIEYKNNTTK